MNQDGTWHEVDLSPGDFVLDGDPAPSPKRGRSPQFSANIYCNQTAGWIKIALDMEVGLGSGHIVVDGDPAPLPQKEDSPPIFGPFLLWPNGWMNQDATWYGGMPQPRRLCVRWGPSTHTQKGAEPPIFGPRLLWPNGCMDQDGTWYEVGLGLRDIVLDGDPAPLP